MSPSGLLLLLCAPLAILATVPTPPSSWWVLGPFPDGAREYNADPICSPVYGNDCIFSLEPGSSKLFNSEFADGGLINWTQVATGSDGSINIPFNNIRWDFITAPLGNEMGAQFQGWAVGTFSSDVDQTVIIQVPGLNEIYLDSRKNKVFGDPYSGGVSFAPVHLTAGSHTLYVRLMGAQGTGFSVSFYAVDSASCNMPTFGDLIVTDFVSGVLASPYISIQPVNADTNWQTLQSINVVSDYVTLDQAEWYNLHNKRKTPDPVATLNKVLSPRMGPGVNISKVPASLTRNEINLAEDDSLVLSVKPSTRRQSDIPSTPSASASISVAPGQPYPLVIPLKQTASPSANITQVVIQVVLTWQSAAGGSPCSTTTNVTLHHRNFTEMYQPYKFTFLDYDQSAQYCVVYPPQNCTAGLNGMCSILFTTHGAGVEADEIINPAWAYAYQQQAAAFILLPTNRRNFGFDWQNAGLFNAFSAFQAFVSGMPGIPAELKTVYNVDPSRVLFGGHSMGGHGCWITSTHFADLALGSAPAAGWIKSELYGPYFLRVGYSHIDSSLRGLLEAAFQEYDTDLHITNLLGVSVIARMGGADTNVPPWMMRRMARLQVEQGGDAVVSEIPGQPHWWGGVVDDAEMQAFYDAHLYAPRPALPTRFTFTCANPNVCGSRGGMLLWQLQLPFRVGRINVEQKGTTWVLATENIRRFAFQNVSELYLPYYVTIDGQTFDMSTVNWADGAHFCQLQRYGAWAVCDDSSFVSTERNPVTYGPFRTIWLNPITIVYATGNSDPVYLQTAVWLSQYWSYQGRGLVNIVADSGFSATQAAASNILLLGGPDVNSAAAKILATGGPYPIKWSGSSFQVGPRTYSAACNGLLALLPHPVTPWNNLVGIAAGIDSCGFAKAAQMIPIKSGETVADWQVSGPEAGWKGVGGLLAAGYWNNQWQFEDILSYVR